MIKKLSALSICALTLAACSTPMQAPSYSQQALPTAVQVPTGHRVALETVGKGSITYECKSKADASGHEWIFVGPAAVLNDRSGKALGRYFGPPATWAANDGSAITGTQVAVAPAKPGDIPLQLVKANPATGAGAMQGLSFIQRVATMGGVAPARMCDAGAMGQKEVVSYQADYIFWRPV
jgi:Protein of unknown function (DUF3455)